MPSGRSWWWPPCRTHRVLYSCGPKLLLNFLPKWLCPRAPVSGPTLARPWPMEPRLSYQPALQAAACRHHLNGATVATSLFLPHRASSPGWAQMQSPQALAHFCVCPRALGPLLPPPEAGPHCRLPSVCSPTVLSGARRARHVCSSCLSWRSHCISAMKAELTVPQLLNGACAGPS